MAKYAIIVAGGSGSRMKSVIPKQFLPVTGRPLLFYTLERFHHYDPFIKIILVLPEKQFNLWKNLCEKYRFTIEHTVVAGGKERFFSVKKGLRLIKEKCLVAVHDGVRPLVSKQTIKKCFETAAKKGTAIPVIPLKESLRQTIKGGTIAMKRSHYLIVQTPQCFDSELLINAYAQKYSTEFTDDASVVEKYGKKIFLVEGNEENIKITSPKDLKVAEMLLAEG